MLAESGSWENNLDVDKELELAPRFDVLRIDLEQVFAVNVSRWTRSGLHD